MSWLPQDYKSPTGNSSYTRLEEGENKLRILTSPIFGWEDWDNKKPIRFRMDNKPSTSIDPTKPVKHFWSFVVWNYRTQKVEIFHVTQRMIQRKLEYLSRDSDWGDPTLYDIKIEKSGSQKDTKYELSPTPKKEISFEIQEAYNDRPIDLEELFSGGDPFTTSPEHRTKAVWETEKKDVTVPAKQYITRNQVNALESLIDQYIKNKAPSWRSDLLNTIKISSFDQLEERFYNLALKRIDEKRKSLEFLEDNKMMDDEVPF